MNRTIKITLFFGRSLCGGEIDVKFEIVAQFLLLYFY